MATFAFRPLSQDLLPLYPSSDGLKARSSLHYFALATLKNSLLYDFFPLCVARSRAGHIAERIPHGGETHSRKAKNSVNHRSFTSILPSMRSVAEGEGRNDEKFEGGSVVDEKMVEKRGRRHRNGSRNRGNGDCRERGSGGLSSLWSTDDGAVKKRKNMGTLDGIKKKTEERMVRKGGKKAKADTAQVELRVGLDTCSKKGEVVGAIALYDSAVREGVKLEPYHYNVLLYLCSSAAIGVVHPAKSGSGGGSSRDNSYCSDDDDLSGEFPKKHSRNMSEHKDFCNGRGQKLQALDSTAAQVRALDVLHLDGTDSKLESPGSSNVGLGRDDFSDEVSENNKKYGAPIHVSDNVRDYARTKGFEIYEKMCFDKIPMTEAALTSVARMAMSMGNGEMAFEIVKQMKTLGLTPRLRSYGPALWTFCNKGDIEKAFEVERHMLESGVYPEEPELGALLRASVEARRGEKVYYILHKLRTSVRQVSPSTADLIESWFKSPAASRVGKRKFDARMVGQLIENNGGGWHGLGWLGKGKWKVARTHVNEDGFCPSCSEKLVTIDLDPIETENFAQSVASIASKRERNSSFQKFQKWLDYYGPFEAVVDAANVGLFSHRRFSINKVNAVVNAIRQKLPSKKWPLIIVHHKRLTGGKMDKPINDKLLEKWKNADAIYATPTGSNDDWYWLYAAIKCKCLIVTNDEMRDHTFQLLGNDFFPRWKERHQVHFSVHDGNFEFHMPPPCSIVIQESKEGHWHIPILAKGDVKKESTWLCLTRNHSCI